MLITCNERKQPEKVPVKAVEKRKHSGSKESKAKKTVTKAPNHGPKTCENAEEGSEQPCEEVRE